MREHAPMDLPSALDPDHAPPNHDDAAKPSRLSAFLVWGASCLVLSRVAAVTLPDGDPVVSSFGAYCCLAACLSGVSAAIFGVVTLARALPRSAGATAPPRRAIPGTRAQRGA